MRLLEHLTEINSLLNGAVCRVWAGSNFSRAEGTVEQTSISTAFFFGKELLFSRLCTLFIDVVDANRLLYHSMGMIMLL